MNQILFVLAMLLFFLSMTACSPSSPSDPSKPLTDADIDKIAAEFMSYELMTPDGALVDPILLLSCRLVTENDIEEAAQRSGPHVMASIDVYMNKKAAQAFYSKSKNYPVGSVVVKDKMPLYLEKESGVGGMVKQPTGYDPENGDWAYFYYEDRDEISFGKLKSCSDCHSAAREQDFVYGDWAGR